MCIYFFVYLFRYSDSFIRRSILGSSSTRARRTPAPKVSAMSTKGRKRRATDSAAAIAGSHVSHAQAVRVQRHFQGPSGVSFGTALQQAKKADADFGESWTPYGTLVKELDLEYKEGNETVRVE